MKRYVHPYGFTYPDTGKIIAAANADRARYLNCQAQRLVLWIRARLPKADPSLRDAACCAPTQPA